MEKIRLAWKNSTILTKDIDKNVDVLRLYHLISPEVTRAPPVQARRIPAHRLSAQNVHTRSQQRKTPPA